MPQIIVTADRPVDGQEAPVMMREWVNLADFQSDHFTRQLVERLGWAVVDAEQAEDRVAQAEAEDGFAEAEADQPPARVLTTAS